MSFNAEWNISGTSIDNASNKFTQSAQKAIKNLNKYQSLLNKKFKEHLDENIRRAGIEGDNLSDVFFMQIKNGNINFINTSPLITQRYEYGYYDGSNDTNEEYYEEYMIQTSPRYFIRPAIQESMNDIGHIVLEEAKKEYRNKSL